MMTCNNTQVPFPGAKNAEGGALDAAAAHLAHLTRMNWPSL